MNRRWGSLCSRLFLVAYVLSRTSGLLGFVERSTTNDAVVAITAAVVAVVTLLPVAVRVPLEPAPNCKREKMAG